MTSLLLGVLGVLAVQPSSSVRPVLDAIRHVESRGDCRAVGDHGRSIGPYQIQRDYHRDSGVPGRYVQVRNRAYAERVVVAYWKRYCPKALSAGNAEVLARVHNGGPNGHRIPQTKRYWHKVKRCMR